MHRISDVRMSGVMTRNLRMFQKLCGSDSLKNVIVATTGWNRVSEETGNKREEELLNGQKFFRPLIQAGGRSARHDNTPDSARRIMAQLLENDPVALQIQEEMRQGKTLEDTTAGADLNTEINGLIAKHQEEMESLREEAREAMERKDERLRKELEQERGDLELKIEKWSSERDSLKQDLSGFRRDASAKQEDLQRKIENVRRATFDDLSTGGEGLDVEGQEPNVNTNFTTVRRELHSQVGSGTGVGGGSYFSSSSSSWSGS